MSDYEKYLFRGKRKDNGDWVYGYYCVFNGMIHCIYTGYAETDCGSIYPVYYEVDPDTVGQYTGLTDKSGNKIFEGDIIEINHPYAGKFVSEVIWDMDCWSLKDFYFTCFDYPNMAFSEGTEYMKVIGNIYDNPELLKKE